MIICVYGPHEEFHYHTESRRCVYHACEDGNCGLPRCAVHVFDQLGDMTTAGDWDDVNFEELNDLLNKMFNNK